MFTDKSIKDFAIKNWRYFLIIIPIFIVIFVRYQSYNLVITDTWAENAANNYAYNQAYNNLKIKFPMLSEQFISSVIPDEIKDFKDKNKDILKQDKKQISIELKDFYQYSSGTHKYVYMGDIDSYYWLRFARNLDEKNMYGDMVENNTIYDTYTIAPGKMSITPSLHPYLIYYNYKIIKTFDKDFTLMESQLLIPTILAIIIAILVFIMMNRAFNPLAALISSIIISVSPIFLSRSLGSDTDIYNIFFPIIIIFFLFEALMCKNSIKQMILMALTGLFVGIYSFAWTGWWYMFYFIIMGMALNVFFILFKKYINEKNIHLSFFTDKKMINLYILFVIFVLSSLLVAVAFYGDFILLTRLVSAPVSFLQSKHSTNPTLFPNVLITVAEFNASTLTEVINEMFGSFYFALALFGLVALAFKYKFPSKRDMIYFLISIAIIIFLVGDFGKALSPIIYIGVICFLFLICIFILLKSEGEHDITIITIFFIWIITSIYASITGVRFALLLVAPIGIGIGITIGYLYDNLFEQISKLLHINQLHIKISLFIILCTILFIPIQAGVATSTNFIPSVNDLWWNELTKINDNSNPDAIINSWWDFGHWFKYIADRRVTFDGASQNSPQLYWIGKALISDSNNESTGILRMLDCSGNNAYDYVENKTKDSIKSINIINKIVSMDKNDAKIFLSQYSFNDIEIDKILNFTHCNPPEDFFITSSDMISKSSVWSHFGSWNFDKARIYQIYKNSSSKTEFAKTMKEEFDLISNDQINTYYKELKNLNGDENTWISGWASYIQGETPCSISGDIVNCPFTVSNPQFNAILNTTSMEIYIPSNEGKKYPYSYLYVANSSKIYKEYNASIGDMSILIINRNNSYSSVFMTPILINSTFTKLFYLDGLDMDNFKLFSSSKDFNNFAIKTWKIKWS